MKVNEFLQDLEKSKLKPKNPNGKSWRDLMTETTSIWSNNAAIGYCVKAMRDAGVPDEQQDTVIRALYRAFDDLTVEEAEEFSR